MNLDIRKSQSKTKLLSAFGKKYIKNNEIGNDEFDEIEVNVYWKFKYYFR